MSDAPEPEPLRGLPETLRNTNRPIIIYQGAQQSEIDAIAGNSLGLLFWLALLSVCLGVTIYGSWSVWNPAYARGVYSPIYAQGRPAGLAKQVEERRQINAQADGIIEFLDRIRADTVERQRTAAVHPLMTDRGGIDDLRKEWDAMCLSIREGIYDRRIAQFEGRILELRQRRGLERDLATLASINSDLYSLQQQRDAEIERRRTDSDPTLRCIPAAQAPVCSNSNADAWCNPQLSRPNEFRDKAL
jgi:hypothetical protein